MASAEDLKQYNLITYILYILGFFSWSDPIYCDCDELYQA